MKFRKLILAVAFSTPLIACAQQQQAMQTTSSGQQAQAIVTEVQPLYESIVVGQNCQPVNVQVEQQPNTGGAVLGGIVGAVIGSRFGGGNGRIAATGAGAIAGTMIGGQPQQGYVRQEMRCTPITQPRQTANAYVAVYNGIRFSGSTYRPLRVGDTIYINVVTMINPAE